ncbi:hypothetical protein L226DRAFT_617392 [Lentinus tigrinus ALCF2SS1-7]|uniref:N-acetyl-D-glucosamine kinase n=1 Tax=Lentinus tigrinus ALCF2SS1-6 TaxID=1328759 RepID=A0A5C2RTB3_9APHY|nr:hypothetical protein L227DRAFT_604605 [Lentinus tigrinus ALCF2SS1-6]RPD68680.1 hypothetical protein L226DRAFT_617392 [Lentinus tigrinus ALCF2SS1-7]
MSYYLCVDCGGSKTAAAIADKDGNIVGRGIGGPSNFAYLGLSNFLQAVTATVTSALQSFLPASEDDKPLLPPPANEPLFAAAWLGVSGVDSAAAIARIIPSVTALLGVEPVVANDTHLLASPLGMHDDVSAAIGCVSGTGGIVVSFRQKEGGGLEELGRVGGWGWILGDEGGGFHVGRSAVRHILWEADCASVIAPEKRNTASTLKDRVLQYFGIDDVFELLTVVHWPDPLPLIPPGTERGPNEEKDAPAYTQIVREKRLSSLAPLVFAAAFEDKDPLAVRVLKHTTSEIVDQLCVLLRPEVDAAEGTEYPARKIKGSETILCFGGSLVGVAAYRQMILDELERRGHPIKRWTYVEDAAGTGAKSLAAAARSS